MLSYARKTYEFYRSDLYYKEFYRRIFCYIYMRKFAGKAVAYWSGAPYGTQL